MPRSPVDPQPSLTGQPGAGQEANSLLIVDDDPVSIRVLRAALPYPDVRFATNGKDALRLARGRPPDIVLLDGEMPNQSGFEVCAELKADELLSEIPVIFVTAHGDLEFETRALEMGAADFIAKPISPLSVQLRVKLHLELRRQMAQLRRLASTDALTGLSNRRTLDEVLEREWHRAVRSSKPLSLVLLDIDHFKQFNDAHGHPAGDECLKKVAEVLRSAARRAGDLVGRYGGEEFAMVLPETTLEGALVVANVLRDGLARAAIHHGASPVGRTVTVSMGLVSTGANPGRTSRGELQRPGIASSDAVLALARAADRALYRAKASGRDRVEIASLEESALFASPQ